MYSSPETIVYDARGNGDGKTTNAIVGGHECSISDYTSIVLVPFCRSARPKFKGDAETWIPAKVANTLNTFDQGETRANELVICLQGNGIDRADTAGCNGKGWNDAGVCYTLNTIDRPAVAYLASGKEKTGTLCAAGYTKLGGQEMFSGDYLVIEEHEKPDGRGIESFCIGNGQVHDAVQMEREKCKTLNCMDDPMKVLTRKV